MAKTIRLYAVLHDGQDGGYSVSLYTSKKEAEQSRIDQATESGAKFDPNDNLTFGYLADGPIKLKLDENGKIIPSEEDYFTFA